MGRKPRGIWRYLENLPPIDWAYLASQRRRFGKGSKMPKHIVEQVKRTKARNKILKRRASTARALRRQIDARKAKLQRNIAGRILGSMQPGGWHGVGDIRILSGAKRGSVYVVIGRLTRAGMVEKVPNPDWDRPGGIHPEFLYRMTVAGETARAGFLNAQMYD